jgi:hypothetical protein
MRRILLVALATTALPAFAGERFLGIIVSAAGADTTNATTAAPFAIPPGAQITMACTAAAFVCAAPLASAPTSACTASLTGANPGVPVSANEKFPTSTSTQATVTVAGSTSSTVRIVGTGAVNCVVWERRGNE